MIICCIAGARERLLRTHKIHFYAFKNFVAYFLLLSTCVPCNEYALPRIYGCIGVCALLLNTPMIDTKKIVTKLNQKQLIVLTRWFFFDWVIMINIYMDGAMTSIIHKCCNDIPIIWLEWGFGEYKKKMYTVWLRPCGSANVSASTGNCAIASQVLVVEQSITRPIQSPIWHSTNTNTNVNL